MKKYIYGGAGGLFATILPVLIIENKEISLLYLFVYLLYLSLQRVVNINHMTQNIVFYKFIQEAHPGVVEKDEVFTGQTFNETISNLKKNISDYDLLLLVKAVITLVVIFFVMSS